MLGIVRGWSRGDRERARLLREGLAHHGIPTVELSAVQEAGGRHRTPQSGQRRRHHLLVRVAGPYDRALRAAALQNLPLLTERPSQEGTGGGDAPTLIGAHRHSVIVIHLPGDVLDIAVHRLTITCLQPHPGSAYLLIDNEKIAPSRACRCTSSSRRTGSCGYTVKPSPPGASGAYGTNALGAPTGWMSTAHLHTTYARLCAWSPCLGVCSCSTPEQHPVLSGTRS